MDEIQKVDKNELVLPSHFDNWFKLAGILIKSQMIPKSLDKPEKVVAVLLKAKELNLPPMLALSSIDIINGVPTLKPQLMLAQIRKSKFFESLEIVDDGKNCNVTMKRKGENPHTEVFGMEDAERMMSKEEGKVIKLSEKFNWRSMPKVMRRWRAISACARIVFPDIIYGMYIPEEIDPTIEMIEEASFEDIQMPGQEPIDLYNELRDSLTVAWKESKYQSNLAKWTEEKKSEIEKLPTNLKDSLKRDYVKLFTKLPKEELNGASQSERPIVEQPKNNTDTSE